MDFVRKVVNGTELTNIIEMPSSLINRKVEILVFPIEDNKKNNRRKKSSAGFLSEYANSNLIEEEKAAWEKEAKE